MSYYDKPKLCPHCGKPMKELTGKGRLFRDVYYPGDEDDWGHSAREAVPTWVCEDCGIKHVEYYKGWNCDYGDEWIFPKGYEKTITPKQESYIRYLCAHNAYIAREEDKDFWSVPYITNVELASKWISDHVAVGEKLQAEDEVRRRVVRSLESIGWRELNAWNAYHDQDKTTFADKESNGDFENKKEFKTFITIDWDTMSVTSRIQANMNMDSASDQDKMTRYLSDHADKVERFKAIVAGAIKNQENIIYNI